MPRKRKRIRKGDDLTSSQQLIAAMSELECAEHDRVIAEKSQTLTDVVNELGLVSQDVEHDGNCFFQAVVPQINSINGMAPLTHESLRKQAVAHISANRSTYAGFVDLERSMDEYLLNAGGDGVWVDHLLVLAFARALNVSLVIINSDGIDPVVIKRPDAAGTICLGYEVDWHYKGLSAEAGNSYFQDLLLQAEVDNYGVSPSPPLSPRRKAFLAARSVFARESGKREDEKKVATVASSHLKSGVGL